MVGDVAHENFLHNCNRNPKGSYFEDLMLFEGGGIKLKRILEKHDARRCTDVFWLDIGLRENRGEQ